MRAWISTLITRGFHGDQEILDKPITNPSRKNKRGFPPDRKRIRKINSYNFCVVPVCQSGRDKSLKERKASERLFLVREVGFEPTNPYGTGASGLRFQDPYSKGLFDLAWQLPQYQVPARNATEQMQVPNWLSPHPQKPRLDQEYWKNV